MAKGFSLLGLFRVRRLQEDIALGALARARREAEEAHHRRDLSRTLLAASSAEAISPAALQSIASSRASAASMLLELEGLSERRRQEVAAAAAAHDAARMRALGLEKLADRFDERTRAEDLAAEQRTLDDLVRPRAETEEESR